MIEDGKLTHPIKGATLIGSGPEIMGRITAIRVTFTIMAAVAFVCMLVPPLAMLWLDAQAQRQADLSSLRLLQVGGAKLLSTAAERVTPVLGCALQQVLGMAEGLLCYTRLDDPEELILHTQGRPLCADDEVRIVNEQGQPVADGEVGELQVRGPYTIRGYYRLPEHNAKAFTADGFYCSGDRVRRTAGGYLVVEGRDKDQINRGGEKIAAEEVENLLLAHPQVHDAALVAMPDAVLGESTCAFIVAREPAPSAFGLKQHLRSQGLAAFKVPDRIEFIPRFPQTGVGKVSRKDLRDSLRPAVFIPESKRLNVLLKEFRSTRNHMAIVVDEYGGVAGLVTIEDVIEQIIGDIEDEYDFDETESNIIRDHSGRYRVKALTEIEDFNAALGVAFADDEYDTIGGLVVSRFGHLPKRGETVTLKEFVFKVIHADRRRLLQLQVRIPHTHEAEGDAPEHGRDDLEGQVAVQRFFRGSSHVRNLLLSLSVERDEQGTPAGGAPCERVQRLTAPSRARARSTICGARPR
jgi:hypothetical protein